MSPYNLLSGNSVRAKLVAFNIYGNSDLSLAGNGAVMSVVPDAPMYLVNNITATNK
jgi:hypothetical protein